MAKIIGNPLPNIPWQDKPADCKKPVWRYSENPIITSDVLEDARSVLNSAAIPYGDGFIGVFRVDDLGMIPSLHVGRSKDGIKWEIEENSINLICEDEEVAGSTYGFDPRVVFVEDRYYVTWCNVMAGVGSTVGIAYTFDFKDFYQLPNAFPLYNRNAVIFPRKIDGKLGMLNRPTSRGHCADGCICYSESPDGIYWGKHRHVMNPTGGWQGVKIGAGPVPIETDEGWLMFYHGVIQMASGMMYCMGGAILDREKPWKVLYRTKGMIMGPETYYERTGDCANVIFPCGVLSDSETGRIAIYYGAADTVVGLCFCEVNEIIDFIKKNSY